MHHMHNMVAGQWRKIKLQSEFSNGINIVLGKSWREEKKENTIITITLLIMYLHLHQNTIKKYSIEKGTLFHSDLAVFKWRCHQIAIFMSIFMVKTT